MTDFTQSAAEWMASSVATDLITALCCNKHTSALVSSGALASGLPPAKRAQVKEDVRTLSTISKKLTGIRYPPRAAHYLEAVFPYLALQRTLTRHPDPVACRTALGEESFGQHLAELAEAIHALVLLKRLLSSPDTWDKERRIFEKEQAYAHAVEDDPAFQNVVASFFETFPRQSPSEWQWGGRREDSDWLTLRSDAPGVTPLPTRDPDWEFQQADTHQEFAFLRTTQPSKDVQQVIDTICHHFCIRAFNGEEVMPQLFDLRVQNRSLLVIAPNYLQLNWARDLPTDVIAVLQQHGDPRYRRTTPQLYEKSARRRDHLADWRRFVFCAIIASHRNTSMAMLYSFFYSHPLDRTIKDSDVPESSPIVAEHIIHEIVTTTAPRVLAEALTDRAAFLQLRRKFCSRYPHEHLPDIITRGTDLLSALRSAPSTYFAKPRGVIVGMLTHIRDSAQ